MATLPTASFFQGIDLNALRQLLVNRTRRQEPADGSGSARHRDGDGSRSLLASRERAFVLGALEAGDPARLAAAFRAVGTDYAQTGATFGELAQAGHYLGDLLLPPDGAGPRTTCKVKELMLLRLTVAGAAFAEVGRPGGTERGDNGGHLGSSQGESRAPGSVPTLRSAQLDLVQRALTATRGNKLKAAKLLGVSRKWLYARLRES